MLLSTKIVISSRSTDLSPAAVSAMGNHITQVPHVCTVTSAMPLSTRVSAFVRSASGQLFAKPEAARASLAAQRRDVSPAGPAPRCSSRPGAGARWGVQIDSSPAIPTRCPLGRIGRAVILAVGLTPVPLAAEAQQATKVARIGVLHPGAPATSKHFAAAFDQGLRELGYLQGQNIVVERRFAEAKVERLSDIAAELVRLKVDVIVTSTDPGIAAVRQQTQTIPIVMANSTDPVGTGFVASLARPGGNVTGLSSLSPELSVKRLELLKEAVPGRARHGRDRRVDHRASEGCPTEKRWTLVVVGAGEPVELSRWALTLSWWRGVDRCAFRSRTGAATESHIRQT